jgi:dihydroorotate dehydrogenase (NAD+) catalytic subunit
MTAPASQPDLSTVVAGTRFASPLLTASGCGGTGKELAGYGELGTLGAFTTRTLTLDPRPGSAVPRVVATAGGVLSETGLHNPGLQAFLTTELPWLAAQQVRAFASIHAESLAEYAELSRRLGSSPGVAGIEVNLRGLDADPYQAGKVLHVVRRDVPEGVMVLAKLSPGTGLVDATRAVVDNGADGVVVAHGYPGVLFDWSTCAPVLGARTGWVSGPAVLAQALSCVWQVHAALPQVSVIGVGGVRTGFDVVQMLLAGASAVQLGTVLLQDPGAIDRITTELQDELAARGLPGPDVLVGRGHRPPDEPLVDLETEGRHP